jgi:hypothetical protein
MDGGRSEARTGEERRASYNVRALMTMQATSSPNKDHHGHRTSRNDAPYRACGPGIFWQRGMMN